MLKLKGRIKTAVNLENLNFKKIHQAVSKFQVDQNVYKPANKSATIHTNQILLSSNRLKLSQWCSTHVFE